MKKVWKNLDAKKRTIGEVAWPVLTWAIAKGFLDADTAVMLAAVLTVWSGVAVGHGLLKTKRGMDAVREYEQIAVKHRRTTPQ